LGSAQTGTGKTAAFSLPIIQKIHEIKAQKPGHHGILALILSPTRELALQIDENIRQYSKYSPLRHTVVYGGGNQNHQVKNLKRGIDILTATPGRLLDLIQQGFIDTKSIRVLVLNEADHMLEMGIMHDIRKIIPLIPTVRQTLFLSATLPDNILQLSHSLLTKQVKIEVSPSAPAEDTVKQFLYYTNKN